MDNNNPVSSGNSGGMSGSKGPVRHAPPARPKLVASSPLSTQLSNEMTQALGVLITPQPAQQQTPIATTTPSTSPQEKPKKGPPPPPPSAPKPPIPKHARNPSTMTTTMMVAAAVQPPPSTTTLKPTGNATASLLQSHPSKAHANQTPAPAAGQQQLKISMVTTIDEFSVPDDLKRSRHSWSGPSTKSSSAPPPPPTKTTTTTQQHESSPSPPQQPPRWIKAAARPESTHLLLRTISAAPALVGDLLKQPTAEPTSSTSCWSSSPPPQQAQATGGGVPSPSLLRIGSRANINSMMTAAAPTSGEQQQQQDHKMAKDAAAAAATHQPMQRRATMLLMKQVAIMDDSILPHHIVTTSPVQPHRAPHVAASSAPPPTPQQTQQQHHQQAVTKKWNALSNALDTARSAIEDLASTTVTAIRNTAATLNSQASILASAPPPADNDGMAELPYPTPGDLDEQDINNVRGDSDALIRCIKSMNRDWNSPDLRDFWSTQYTRHERWVTSPDSKVTAHDSEILVEPEIRANKKWFIEANWDSMTHTHGDITNRLKVIYGEEEASFYTRFFGVDHTTHENVGTTADNVENPCVISIQRPESLPANTNTLLAIVRTKAETVRVLLPLLNGGDSPKQLRVALKQFAPVTEDMKLVLLRNPEIIRALDDFEAKATRIQTTFKVGVLYVKPNQKQEDDMFGNQESEASKDYHDFLEWLGRKVELKGWERYRGGLDVKADDTGSQSYYTEMRQYQIMFHVATLLPFQPQDTQHVERKRHIGNDVSVIVFKDQLNADDRFNPMCLTSHFIHCVFVVSVAQRDQVTGVATHFKLTVANKSGVAPYGPFIPQSNVFEKTAQFHEWFLTKIINGNRMAFNSPEFFSLVTSRKMQLANICQQGVQLPPPQ